MKVYVVETWQDNEDDTGTGRTYISHVFMNENRAKEFCQKDKYSDYDEMEVEE